MLEHIKFTNPLKLLEALNCGPDKLGFLDAADFEVEQFETKTFSTDYKPPQCAPDYCPYHQGIRDNAKIVFDRFPNCCPHHAKLNQAPWFVKKNYDYLPEKIFTTIIYTHHIIDTCCKNRNWFKEITDYIEYTVRSFGQLRSGYGGPVGLSMYLPNIIGFIDQRKILTGEQKKILKDFIQNQYVTRPEKVVNTDLNILIENYKSWKKIFPFEIDFFKHLKPYFDNIIPLLASIQEPNLYDKLVKATPLTKEVLAETLTATTISLITEINSYALFHSGRKDELKDIELKLILAHRNIEIQALKTSPVNEQKEYIKVLKTWMEGEKAFIKEIKPFLESISEDQNNSTMDANPATPDANIQEASAIQPILLSRFPAVEKIYSSALEKIRKNEYHRNILDDLRLATEMLVKAVTASEKSLENQRQHINEFLRSKGNNTQCGNLVWQLIDYFCKYQNDYVKHNDAVNPKEVELIFDQTNTIMRFLLKE